MPGVFSKRENLPSSSSTVDLLPLVGDAHVYEITLGQRNKQATQVNCTFLEQVPPEQPVHVNFNCHLPCSIIVTLRTVCVNNTLYINVLDGSLSDESKEAFMMLMDFADKILKCCYAVVYMPRVVAEQEGLIKIFGCLGFFVIPEESPLIHFHGTNNIFMGFIIR